MTNPWRNSNPVHERELRQYHDNIRAGWGSFAVQRFAEELIAKWRESPPVSRRHAPINGGEEYASPRRQCSFETFVDDCRPPGD